MQVKKFEAPTIQEALENVKRELGPEAIILQTKKNKRGFGLMSKASVEVTAAVSDRSLNKKKNLESRLPEQNRTNMMKLSAERQAETIDKYTERNLEKASYTRENLEVGNTIRKITATRYIDIPDEGQKETEKKSQPPSLPSGVQEEIRNLKKMVEDLKAEANTWTGKQQESAGASSLSQQLPLDLPSLRDAFEQLVIHGIDRRYAFPLVKKVAFELGPERSKNPEIVLDSLASEILDSIEVHSLFSGMSSASVVERGSPFAMGFVGPTGVGKTTTIAKIASEALMRKKLKVGLINLDDYKPASFDQLGTYAKILNVPFRSVSSPEDLKVALSDFHNLDLVLLDTTGRSQRDPDSLKQMQTLFKTIPDLQTYLVLSATTRDAELYDAAHRFSTFSPRGVVISKLDEAMTYGSIYNVSLKAKLPLVYFTTGQKIPDDIEEATKERLVALVMDI